MKIPDEKTRNNELQWIEMLDRNYRAALNLLPLTGQKSYANAILAADCYRLMNKPDKARSFYDSARVELEKLVQDNPENYNLRSWISFAYAGLNMKDEAISNAERNVDRNPISKDAFRGPVFVRNLAIVYVMVGEYEAAMDKIEYLLSIPTGRAVFSVPMLRIDPTWDPLRSHPRFRKILEKYGNPQRQ
ncbi:hypothetical protein L0244_14710 [bacterium]|nr:hypothetical protein [bacterium]